MAFRLPAYDFPTNALLNLSPINEAIGDFSRRRQQDIENQRQNKLLKMREDEAALQRDRFGLEQGRFGMDRDRFGRDMAQRDLTDPLQVRQMQAGIDRAPLDDDIKRSQANLHNAHAEYYRGRSKLDQRPPAGSAAPPNPLDGAGIDEQGNMVLPRQPGSRAPDPFNPSEAVKGTDILSGRKPNFTDIMKLGGPGLSPPMRLGGPIDDIDRSMMPDEGRGRPQGVQVAQMGGGAPSLMDQARQRAFGPTGVTSPEVPGVVTDAGRNRRVDMPATRAAEGQRAVESATPDQQERFQKFRQEQAFWTQSYGSPPRAGYYYGPDGREMPKTDKNFKGDREAQAVALLNMRKIESASDRLLKQDYVSRTALGALNVGEIGQAFADMKQGAMGLAYALSGKTVAVAEMRNFIEAYGPVPGDGADRIANKTQRMREFYQSLLTASRGGESYETAFARAMAATGLKNPDGTPAQPSNGPTGAPSQNQPAPGGSGVRGMTTDDLIKRLNGGR